MTTTPLPPVQRQVRVALAPERAFDLFTRQMARWWPFRGHSGFDEDAVDVVFDGRIGGEVTEHARDGRRMVWGVLTEWQPPHGFAMRWHPGLDAAEATLLRVTFAPMAGGGTEVAIHHGGWEARGTAAAEKRDQYDHGWPATMAAFEAYAGRIATESAR
jgi:hypothetical protein